MNQVGYERFSEGTTRIQQDREGTSGENYRLF